MLTSILARQITKTRLVTRLILAVKSLEGTGTNARLIEELHKVFSALSAIGTEIFSIFGPLATNINFFRLAKFACLTFPLIYGISTVAVFTSVSEGIGDTIKTFACNATGKKCHQCCMIM